MRIQDKTILREAEEYALSKVSFEGRVLDLGGDRNSHYFIFFNHADSVTIVNLNKKTEPNIEADLEDVLPIASETYDVVTLINVLEHVFNQRQLLEESHRVLAEKGTLIFVVPFLFPVHPSPDDYWRMTDASIKRLMQEVGFSDIVITPLGTGLFSVIVLLCERLCPKGIRIFSTYCIHPIARCMDAIFSHVAKRLGKQYEAHYYPLGYLVQAKK